MRYQDRMEKSWVTHCRAEEGLSIQEAERVIESEMFLDEYPRWELGTPHWTVILHKMFLHAVEWGQKEAECICCWGWPGSPSCGASRRRRAIQDILSSLQAWLEGQTYSAKTKGPGAHGRKRVGTEPPQSYEATLQAAHQKALETAEALHDDLERLNGKCRERSWAHSQSRSQPRGHLRSYYRGCSQTWAHNQSPPHADSWGVCSHSLDGTTY